MAGDEGVAAEEQFVALFEAHYSSLVGLARVLCRDASVAEDVVQDAFERTRLAWWRIRTPDRAAAYVRQAVVNQCRGRWRRQATADRARAVEPDAASIGPAERAEASARRAVVLAAIDELPKRQRECVVLRYYSDLSDREIAAALGVSLGSVKTHLHRANAALAMRLGGER